MHHPGIQSSNLHHRTCRSHIDNSEYNAGLDPGAGRRFVFRVLEIQMEESEAESLFKQVCAVVRSTNERCDPTNVVATPIPDAETRMTPALVLQPRSRRSSFEDGSNRICGFGIMLRRCQSCETGMIVWELS